MSELDKLEAYLKENGYDYERIDKYADPELKKQFFYQPGMSERHQIIVKDGKRQWDAICQWGSYGFEQGLLEIYGSIVHPKMDGDTVVGYLTAQDIIERLEANKRG